MFCFFESLSDGGGYRSVLVGCGWRYEGGFGGGCELYVLERGERKSLLVYDGDRGEVCLRGEVGDECFDYLSVVDVGVQ